ncbi:hypothetical protein JXM83_06415 [Candidatus Woesearchaeota archaeon]|nr:hypothetical protein [Candidatus Woesearchaeota archaeon]
MAFIRIKNINGNPYAYLVKNKWTKKGPRQGASKYLGPVFQFPFVEEKDFENFILEKYKKNVDEFFKDNKAKDILEEIIFCELNKFGFLEYKGKKGTKKKSVILKNVVVDLNNIKVYNVDDEKSVVLKLNSDFMCAYSLKKLFGFLEYGNEMEVAPKLAKAFIFADIPIDDHIFVRFFKKCFKNDSLRIS